MAANNDNESITTCETHLNAQKDELGKDDEANQQEEPLDDSRFDNDEDEDEDEVSLESTCVISANLPPGVSYEDYRNGSIASNRAFLKLLFADEDKDMGVQIPRRPPRKRSRTSTPTFTVRSSYELRPKYVDEDFNSDDFSSTESEAEKEHAPIRRKRRHASYDELMASRSNSREHYTEKHVQALGTAKKPFTSKDKGILDPVHGSTCHQCRQKTTCPKTICSQCSKASVRGQFCGVCLWNRYGENIEEVSKNNSWVCPVCRDICNCSICRTKKGLVPTGQSAPAAVENGFKSVAHMLIEQHLQETRDIGISSDSTTSTQTEPTIPHAADGECDTKLNETKKPEITGHEASTKQAHLSDSTANSLKSHVSIPEKQEQQHSSKKRLSPRKCVAKVQSSSESDDRASKESVNAKDDKKPKEKRTTPKRYSDSSVQKLKLEIGMQIACYPDEQEKDPYWIATVIRKPDKNQEVEVEWFETIAKTKQKQLLFKQTKNRDLIPVGSIFSKVVMLKIKTQSGYAFKPDRNLTKVPGYQPPDFLESQQ